MNEWEIEWDVGRRAEIAVRANAFAKLLKGKGIVIFNFWPKRGESFWRNASCTLEVLAIMPKDEWPRVKEMLREMGWRYSGGEKQIVYFGRGKKMVKTLVVSYSHETNSYAHPLAFIDLVWYKDSIMICVLAYYWRNGYEEINPLSLERYAISRTYAELLIDELRRAGVALMTLSE